MSDVVYLGVDLGAESGRVMAGRFDGRQLRLEEIHRFANTPVRVAGTLRWNLIGLWKEIQDGLRKAAAKFGNSIASVGVDTWGVDYVLLRGDEIVAQPYHYRDARTRGVLDWASGRVSRADIFAQTGLQFMEINTLYQLIAAQQNTPEILAGAERLLLIPDFFHWLLSGSRVVEFTNATTTQFFNPTTRDWAFDLLGQFEIPTGFLPEVVPPGTRLGPLRPDVCADLGLPRIPVIAPPTHDTGSAVAAVPTALTGRANWAYISSGTWSLIGVEVQDAVLTPAALAQNVTNEGGVDGTFRLLKNVMGLWLVQQSRRSFEQAGQTWDYTRLTQAAAEATPFRSIIDPNHDSLLNPADMPTAIREACRRTGQPVPETEGAVIRCALESLALKYRHVLRGLEQLTGERVEVIHVVGGGSNNDLLNQFTADACGVPVEAGPTEATVMGNLLTQARSAGEIASLSDLRSVVRQSFPVKRFEPRQAHEWAAANERFDELVSAAGRTS